MYTQTFSSLSAVGAFLGLPGEFCLQVFESWVLLIIYDPDAPSLRRFGWDRLFDMGFICSQTLYLQHFRPIAHKLDKFLYDMMVKNMKSRIVWQLGMKLSQ